MRVAAVQMTSTMDRAANRVAAVGAVEGAAALGAGLVVLPEATMCTFGEAGTDLVPLAEPLDGPFVTALADVAVRCGCTVVAGTFEPAPDPHRVHNTVVAVGPGGLLGAYRKYHLYDALGWRESAQVLAGEPSGDPPLVFEIGGLTFGVMTCYDLRFPEMARLLADRGATVLVEPAHWMPGPGKAAQWSVLLRARAIETTAYVVAAAKPAPECTGHSVILDPSGDELAGLGADEQATIVADLDPVRVEEVRAGMPVLSNRRFTVVIRS